MNAVHFVQLGRAQPGVSPPCVARRHNHCASIQYIPLRSIPDLFIQPNSSAQQDLKALLEGSIYPIPFAFSCLSHVSEEWQAWHLGPICSSHRGLYAAKGLLIQLCRPLPSAEAINRGSRDTATSSNTIHCPDAPTLRGTMKAWHFTCCCFGSCQRPDCSDPEEFSKLYLERSLLFTACCIIRWPQQH